MPADEATRKAQKKAATDKWRAANPAKVREQSRRYREANREKTEAARAAWRSSERGIAKEKAWREANKDRLLATNRAYRKRHPERAKAYDKKWKAANPGKVRARRNRWYARNRESVLARRVKAAYGVSPEQHAEMLKRQGGCCAVCERPFVDKRGKRPHVDHCHATGKVRGLLCGQCNSGLGMFRDDPDAMRKAIAYLAGR